MRFSHRIRADVPLCVIFSLEQRLEALSRSTKADTAKDSDQKKLELEWQQLEYAIQSLEKENQHAPPLDSSAVLDIRTRAELHDLNLQYASALEMLKSELASERDALLRETQLRSDLEIVQTGLQKRLAQLQRKKRQDLASESAIRYVLLTLSTPDPLLDASCTHLSLFAACREM